MAELDFNAAGVNVAVSLPDSDQPVQDKVGRVVRKDESRKKKEKQPVVVNPVLEHGQLVEGRVCVNAGNVISRKEEETQPKQPAPQEQDEKPSPISEENFIERVTNYPVVASTLDKAWDLYSACKESNNLVKYSLETAEGPVKYVSGTVVSVATKFEKPVSSLNAVACSGLDFVEDKCPVVKKPTDEIIADTKSAYEANVKPSVDAVVEAGQYAVDTCSSIKDYSVSTVNGVTTYTSETITMARDASYEKMNMIRDKSYETVNAVLATPAAQTVFEKIDDALTVVENYVDEYLPPEKKEKMEEGKPDDTEEVDEAQARSRPVEIYDKAKQRLYARAMGKLSSLKLRSRETLDRFNFTVNLIDYAKGNLNAVNERVASSLEGARAKGMYWWDEIMKDDSETNKDDPDQVAKSSDTTLESQALKVAHSLTLRLRSAIHALNERNIPEHLRERYNAAKQYSVELAGSFVQKTRIEEVSDSVMTKAREQAVYIQETIDSVANVATDSWPLNQLTPDFVIDDLGDTDDELMMDENDNSNQ